MGKRRRRIREAAAQWLLQHGRERANWTRGMWMLAWAWAKRKEKERDNG